MDSQGFKLSRMVFEFFPKPVYPIMVEEKLQIHHAKHDGKYICESNLFIYTHALKQKSPSDSYHYRSK